MHSVKSLKNTTNTTNIVAIFFRARLCDVNKPYKDRCIIRDKIVKQSCYFAKICDGEFNKKCIGLNLFSLQLCLHK